jgi:hypothetical protein
MTLVPEGRALNGRLLTGLKACCKAPYDESKEGQKLCDDLCCEKPLRVFLVECVSCTVQCSGQHRCPQCNKVVRNFAVGLVRITNYATSVNTPPNA